MMKPEILTFKVKFDLEGQGHSPSKTIGILTHWGRVTHISVSNLTIIGLDNGLSPVRRQAIIWTNAGILLIGPLVTNFSEISIEIYTFSIKKRHLKISEKWRPFCLGLNVLTKVFCTSGPNLVILAWMGNELQSSRMDFMLRLPNCTDKHQMLIILTNPMSDTWILRLTKQTCWCDFGKTGVMVRTNSKCSKFGL